MLDVACFQLRRRSTCRPGALDFTITLLHQPGAWPRPVRRIQAEVRDTGPGFDWRVFLQARPSEDLRPFGRGIALMAALGQHLEYNERGNQVRFSLDCL